MEGKDSASTLGTHLKQQQQKKKKTTTFREGDAGT